ncbi:hypothetical protein IFM89_029646 [Coptis chinensis]|uniref:At1g61320/AtMIF1 LRR domain-containing protein n=1 Tax=Coptis chinensis TaxID=261450 RepID=A0A835IH82_9MAGN|nr:hypothetical protein IFM89_029646 [Coptis chinensis]
MDMAIAQIKDFTHHIDQWIEMAITKRSQNPDIGSSHFVIQREIYSDGNLYYQFPSLFSNQEIGSSIKCLSLKGCSFRSLDSKGYCSLIDLRLKKVFIVKDTIKIKINAENLTTFLYAGKPVEFMPINVPKLSNVIIRPMLEYSSHALLYALGKLSSDIPQMESLMLSVAPIEEKKLPKQLALFANLKKLVLLVRTCGETLRGFIPLLRSSPYLQRLELHLSVRKSERIKEGLMERPSDFPHFHLEEIILSGFSGCSHDIEFAAYLLSNVENLKRLTIYSRRLYYEMIPATLTRESQERVEALAAEVTCKDKKTEKGAWEQLENLVRPGVELLLA